MDQQSFVTTDNGRTDNGHAVSDKGDVALSVALKIYPLIKMAGGENFTNHKLTLSLTNDAPLT